MAVYYIKQKDEHIVLDYQAVGITQ